MEKGGHVRPGGRAGAPIDIPNNNNNSPLASFRTLPPRLAWIPCARGWLLQHPLAGFLILPNAVVPDEAPGARTTELRTLDFTMADHSCSTACELSPSLASLAPAGCVGS